MGAVSGGVERKNECPALLVESAAAEVTQKRGSHRVHRGEGGGTVSYGRAVHKIDETIDTAGKYVEIIKVNVYLRKCSKFPPGNIPPSFK